MSGSGRPSRWIGRASGSGAQNSSKFPFLETICPTARVRNLELSETSLLQSKSLFCWVARHLATDRKPQSPVPPSSTGTQSGKSEARTASGLSLRGPGSFLVYLVFLVAFASCERRGLRSLPSFLESLPAWSSGNSSSEVRSNWVGATSPPVVKLVHFFFGAEIRSVGKTVRFRGPDKAIVMWQVLSELMYCQNSWSSCFCQGGLMASISQVPWPCRRNLVLMWMFFHPKFCKKLERSVSYQWEGVPKTSQLLGLRFCCSLGSIPIRPKSLPPPWRKARATSCFWASDTALR